MRRGVLRAKLEIKTEKLLYKNIYILSTVETKSHMIKVIENADNKKINPEKNVETGKRVPIAYIVACGNHILF